MGGAGCQASRKKAPANRLGQSAEYPSATTTCPPVTSLLSCPPSAMLGCRPVAGELLDVAMHDLICIMYEMRLRPANYANGIVRRCMAAQGISARFDVAPLITH